MSQNFFRKVVPMCCSLMLVLAACGGGSSSLSPDADLGVLSPTEQMIFSKYYAGSLTVYLNDEIKTQVADKSLLAVDSNQQTLVQTLQNTVSAHADAKIKPLFTRQGQMAALDESAAKYFKLVTGKEQNDLRNVVRVEVQDPSTAVGLLRKLKKLSFVKLVYPSTVPAPSGMMDVVPELADYQQYLGPLRDAEGNFLGGLGIMEATSLYGVESDSDVWIIDEDLGAYTEHPDLELNWLGFGLGGDTIKDLKCDPSVIEADYQLRLRVPNGRDAAASWRDGEYSRCSLAIPHGTAVLGILGALGGNGGVDGIVPVGARFLLSQIDEDELGWFAQLVDGQNQIAPDFAGRDLVPGSIWIAEYHLAGVQGNADRSGGCDMAVSAQDIDPNDPYNTNPCYGFLPAESNRVIFDAVRSASDFGVTVIEGAGNGSADLDDPQFFDEGSQHFLSEESGAIIVGASQGQNFAKHPVSNCGSKVDVFAWGQNVVTTTWRHDGGIDWEENPEFGGDPSAPGINAYYANNFSGTSSATAIIGGVAGLVQSFAKQELGSRSRYLMPAKIKEILITSGVPQAGNDCNIGVQPQADEALRLVREFVQEAKQQYPELTNNQQLSAERIQSLRDLGVGLICADYQVQAPTVSQPEITLHPDASCNESVVHAVGSRIAKDLDFDGDNRAELVKWTRDGGWQVDLSSVGGGEFGFGAWNITVNNPAGLGEWVSPYAIDLDSDGRTDFVLYDRENNVWNVLYTRWSILQGSQGQWREFQYDTNDWVDDRKLDWKHSNYSRPVPGDYNGDGWVDIAIACSDGIWRIDYSDEGEFDGDFEDENERITFLDEAKLEAAPGWAWLPFIDLGKPAYRTPDALADAGDLYRYDFLRDEWRQIGLLQSTGNNQVLEVGEFDGDGSRDLSFKNSDGSWQAQSVLANQADELYLADLELPQSEIFGGSECHPTAADFDGDSLTDRAVLCPDGWTVAYSAPQGDEYISRRYTGNGMGYDADEFTVPGRVYFGGISYAKSVQLINFALQANPRQAPPIPVDMVTPYVGGD